MIEKGRISALQMSLLLYANIVSTGVLLAPGISYKYAGRDMWLSPIWGSIIGFFLLFIVYRLYMLYPWETFIQYIQHILGRIPGKVVGFFFLCFFLHEFGMAIRVYGDFLVGVFLNKTPLLMVMGSLALASAFAVRAGLEVLARLSNIFVPILIVLWLIIVLLLVPELEVKKMFPIMEDGIMPSLMGSIVPTNWFMIIFHLSSLLPFLINRKLGLKGGLFSLFGVMLTLVITNLTTLLLFGRITGSFVYPVISASRYISYADFFENLEALVMVLWIGGMFIKLGLYHYVLVLNTAQWLNLSDYKQLALPIGLLLTLYGFWVAPNSLELSHFLSEINPFISTLFYIIIPFTLLMIALLRSHRQKILN